MPATFGQQLTEARELRGLSIEDASFETRIPVARLRLLESGNLAAFGSMTYARSFIRRYSEYLEVDASEMLEELPAGVLGGERDYRYLTQSHGPWLREHGTAAVSAVKASTGGLNAIKSPLPTAIAVFVLILAGTAMWGKHVADTRRKEQVSPAEAQFTGPSKTNPTMDDGTGGTVALKAKTPVTKQIDFPVSVRKAMPVD